ncbi:O-antigen/teichoic acid export membrane protein [Flavobacterium sp. 90]|uniref:MATE family efflux transporter n=1 Tax=unclassified Flavobacterium TaxID=196869 RepID=UPI000EAD28E6|nr:MULTISPECIES: MATE family efflux transporter [unclassified Flavobacterium]RKR10215.1 O-antigen/teichoic acid export membrane protein [Flavobacterium sp. 81]TCK54001.1 O-antigen/teichoic acid export membrane protein [Flavobacterium sp. 90]
MKTTSILKKITQNPFLKQSLSTLFLRIFGVLLLFGFTIFLTKSYTPKLVGQYDFARSFLLAIGSICLLGFEQSILYFKGRLASQSALEELKSIYTKMVTMLLLTSVLVLVVILVIDKKIINNYFADQEVYSILLKGAATLFFYGIFTLNTEVFRALDKLYVAELFRNILKYIPLLIGSIVLFYWNKETYLVDVFLIGFVLLAIVSSILLFGYFRQMAEVEIIEKITHKEVFLRSYPIAISGMALFLLMCFDIMFLKKYRNDETVAFYSVGVKLMTIVSVIIVTVNITISAKISEYFTSNNVLELKKVIRKSVRLIFGITFPVILLMCIFSEYILSFFGHQYIAAQEPFLILIIGQGICSAFGPAPVYLNMTGRQHVFQIILIIAVAINFVLNRFLIPVYGMNGAAIAFVSSSFFWNFVTTVFIYKKDRIKIFLH